MNIVVRLLDRVNRRRIHCVAKGSIGLRASDAMVDVGAKSRNALSANLEVDARSSYSPIIGQVLLHLRIWETSGDWPVL